MGADINAVFLQTAVGLLLFSALLISTLYYLYWRTHLKGRKSPFSGQNLARGKGILYPSAEKIHLFSSQLSVPENEEIDLSKAAFCRQTNRIFPNAITVFDEINVRRDYLSKYYSSKLTPWFLLSDAFRKEIENAHSSLDGFQIGKSLKPGPLFVDKKNRTLVGWKQIPETEMEILVIQKLK